MTCINVNNLRCHRRSSNLVTSKYEELRAYVTENLTWLVASRRNRALSPPGAAPTASAPELLPARGLARSAAPRSPGDTRPRCAFPQEGQRATAENASLAAASPRITDIAEEEL
jgi:hypothetical protein